MAKDEYLTRADVERLLADQMPGWELTEGFIGRFDVFTVIVRKDNCEKVVLFENGKMICG